MTGDHGQKLIVVSHNLDIKMTKSLFCTLVKMLHDNC